MEREICCSSRPEWVDDRGLGDEDWVEDRWG